MALLTYQSSVQNDGITLTMASASGGGDTIGYSSGGIMQMNSVGVPTPKYNGFLVVRNADATTTNVTLVTPGATADIVVAVAAGALKVIGPLTDALVDPATGTISVTYSKVTSLTVGVFQA